MLEFRKTMIGHPNFGAIIGAKNIRLTLRTFTCDLRTGDGSYAVEASLSGIDKSWEFIRITHMDLVGFRRASLSLRMLSSKAKWGHQGL